MMPRLFVPCYVYPGMTTVLLDTRPIVIFMCMEEIFRSLTWPIENPPSEEFAQSAQREFSFDSFQDLCILLGNDFNTNIPQMGEVGSWKTILKYGNIPALSQDRDVAILRYPEVKALFCSTQVQVELDPAQLTFNQDQFKANGRNILLMAELGSYFDRILESLSSLVVPHSADHPLTSRPKIELEIISDQIADDGETRIELTGLRYALNQIETIDLPSTEPTP